MSRTKHHTKRFRSWVPQYDYQLGNIHLKDAQRGLTRAAVNANRAWQKLYHRKIRAILKRALKKETP